MRSQEVIQGRLIGPDEVKMISDLLAQNPGWNRTQLSREVCRRWDWRNGNGQIKDMAARSLLLKLQARGLITLPKRAHPGRPNHRGFAAMREIAHQTEVIQQRLEELKPLRIEVLGRGNPHLDLFKFLLQRYHYIGYRTCAGENIKLMVWDARERLLACLLFGAAAWKCAPRDKFLGWSEQERQRNLQLLANNLRFLILPWVRVPHLASHVLARVARNIRTWWIERYGHPVEALETFVQRDRFLGTCYRAAGWVHVGVTKGLGRNSSNNARALPVKDIFVFPLSADFQKRLRR